MAVLIQRYGGILAGLALVWTATLSGCGAGAGSPCEADADCGENQICAGEQCRRTCTTDEDCLQTTQTCRSWVDSSGGDPVNLCLAPADAGGRDADTNTCTSDEECRARYDAASARCGIDGRCVIAQPDYGLLIRDRSEIDESSDRSRRGAEIGAIFTLDTEGNPARHADAREYHPGAGLTGEAHLDGSAVELDASEKCVTAPLTDHTTPLGGGELLVEFAGGSGDTPTLAVGEEVAIVEWAEDNCGDSQDDVDEYDVYLCVSETGTLGTDDCEERILQSASGYTRLVPRSK